MPKNALLIFAILFSILMYVFSIYFYIWNFDALDSENVSMFFINLYLNVLGIRRLSLFLKWTAEDSTRAVEGRFWFDLWSPQFVEQCLRGHAPRDCCLFTSACTIKLYNGWLLWSYELSTKSCIDEWESIRYRPPEHNHRICKSSTSHLCTNTLREQLTVWLLKNLVSF